MEIKIFFKFVYMFKKFKIITIIFLLASVFYFSTAALASVDPYQPTTSPAQTQPQSGAFSEMETQLGAAQKGAGYSAPEDPRLIASQIIKTALGFLGIIFLGLIIYGGFLWMTAGGNEESVGKAKKTIYYAVIGLLIVMAAYSITYFAFRIAFRAYTPASGIKIQAPDQFKGQGGDYAPFY